MWAADFDVDIAIGAVPTGAAADVPSVAAGGTTNGAGAATGASDDQSFEKNDFTPPLLAGAGAAEDGIEGTIDATAGATGGVGCFIVGDAVTAGSEPDEKILESKDLDSLPLEGVLSVWGCPRAAISFA